MPAAVLNDDADAALLRALCEKGRRLELGEGVEQDARAALRCYREAAEAGFAEGQWRLGTCYHEAIGVAEDEAEGCRWFRLAAEQGHAEAQYDLALCYDVGSGVPEDRAEALRWYHRAAELGQAEAQFHLGESYEEGWGVEEDEEAALYWYGRAAEQGYEEAVEYMQPVEPEVEPASTEGYERKRRFCRRLGRAVFYALGALFAIMFLDLLLWVWEVSVSDVGAGFVPLFVVLVVAVLGFCRKLRS